MNITYITNFPSIDVKHWSGLVYYMAKSLEREADMEYITGLEENWPLSLKIKNKIYGRNKIYRADRSPEIGKGYARQILKQLKQSTDIVFSPSTTVLSYLDTNKPKVIYTDATFASMINYYNYFTNLSTQYTKEGMKTEQLSLDSCKLAIFSSQWAADSAIRDYNTDPSKIRIVPFGANLPPQNLGLEDIKKIVEKRNGRTCQLLFLGVEWHRKGGDIAIEAVKYLNESLNLPAELHIVGIDDLPVEDLPPYIINHGRISKGTPEGVKRIEDLITHSHFLFIPSRADCTPVVFSEAMSYGVPCVSSNTGGIPSILNEDNGIVLPSGIAPEEYAKRIYEAFIDNKRYNELALSAFNDYKTRLNWDVAMGKVVEYMKEL
ncbi:glycosyl transferase [Bacteroidia bacterium]|nr:glycosyl transferase [Bacteroidia bacterium]